MAYNLINASLCVASQSITDLTLEVPASWKTKDLYNTTDENLDKSQLIGGISKPAAMFWCLRTFFSPVGCFSGNKPRQAYGMSGLQWSAPCLRGSLCWVQSLPQGCGGFSLGKLWSKWGGELSGMESVCRGGAGHGAGHGLHENRNQGSDLLLGVSSWARNNLQAWRKYSHSSFQLECLHITLQNLGISDFYLFFTFVTFSGIWSSIQIFGVVSCTGLSFQWITVI